MIKFRQKKCLFKLNGREYFYTSALLVLIALTMTLRKFLPEFLSIPYKLILDNSLTPLDLKVYGIILWFRKTTKQKKCFAKNATIAVLLSTEKRKIVEGSIQASITRLEKSGYVKRIFIDEAKRHRKEIIPIVDQSNNGSKNGQTNQMMGLDQSNDGSVDPSNDGHSNNKRSKKNIDRNSSTPFPEKLPEGIHKKILQWYCYSISNTATSEKITMTSEVKKIISGALKEFSPLDLLLAIKGFSDDAWQLQNNGFRGPEWFFSSNKRLSQYIGLFNKHRSETFIKKAEEFLLND